MRKVGIVVGTILLVLIVAVVVFGATFNVNQYRGTIQSELEKHLDRRVVLGDMHLGIFPPLALEIARSHFEERRCDHRTVARISSWVFADFFKNLISAMGSPRFKWGTPGRAATSAMEPNWFGQRF